MLVMGEDREDVGRQKHEQFAISFPVSESHMTYYEYLMFTGHALASCLVTLYLECKVITELHLHSF